ncbi:hypothetical protein A2U01_0112328, partial [Trifolium medium]|nr:hypothetical protein [Trifolium medium]
MRAEGIQMNGGRYNLREASEGWCLGYGS